MGATISTRGKLYENKGRVVFVSSPNGCPRINLPGTGKDAKIRDDFSRGFKSSRKLAKLIFQ